MPIYHKQRMQYKNIFCSKECESQYKKSKNLNCECEICHIRFHRKQSWIDKNQHQYCSRECQAIANKELMKGEGNHQYGLKGKLNASWKSDEKISYYGYRLIRVLDHPFKNSDDMVFEHRLVAEQFLLTEENQVIIDGHAYLSPEYHVHHLDFDRLNNDISNIYILPKGIHVTFHNHINQIIRNDNTGRIEAVINAKNIYSKEELIKMFYDFINTLTETERGSNGFGSTTK